MRCGVQLVVDALRGRLQKRWSDSEFALLLETAAAENVTPWVVKCFREQEADLSPQQTKRLEELHRSNLISAFVWSTTLKSILDAFHRAGLPVIPLKGPSLAERIYGDSSLRKCHDLDLLVQGRDLIYAEQVLKGLGFTPSKYGDDYHRAFNRNSINIELHHNVENAHRFEFEIERTWSSAVPSDFQGIPVLHLAPFDELLYLCLHAVRHRYDRICLILDLSLAFRRLPLPIGSIVSRSDTVFDNILLLGWMMATRLDEDIPALQIKRLKPSDHVRLEKIAGRLWQERMLGQLPPLGWVALHRFYIELESPGRSRLRRRCRHLRILSSRLIDVDFDFASRFNLHRKWQVRLLRPIRLLIERVQASRRLGPSGL